MISLLIVNFRSAALAACAIESGRRAASVSLQVVVVDNSCDPVEAEALRPLADVLLVSNRNRGYSGGINDGRRHCSGETIIVCNPDVQFGSDALDHLHNALATAEVAGPAFSWDTAGAWLLPPGDVTTAWEKVDVILAGRSASWRAWRDRRRVSRRIAFWSLNRSTSARTLSGAVLAIRASTFDRLNGFDERFALYFEETDFLRRLDEDGGVIAYVPAARCRHLYNQSAGQTPVESAGHYAESERKYLEKWNGPFLARILKRLERPQVAAPSQPLRGALALDREDVVVEISPLPGFETAAGHFPRSKLVEIPPEIVDSTRAGALYIRTVDRETGEVLARYVREPVGSFRRD